MATEVWIDELVDMLEGPETRRVEYRFGAGGRQRTFKAALREPGEPIQRFNYQQQVPEGDFDSLPDRFWHPTGAWRFWRRAGISQNKFWGV